ncbi:IS66 family transposase [Candidatus Kaiserbacteria bacterium]|nr:IS66 family transposase [Candidatus Kaiserbacteria bacterium]
MRLIDEAIKQRLIRLRNLELLYAKARERIALLEAENKRQKERIAELEKNDKDKGAKLEALAFQLEQIKNKLFGKKPLVYRILPKKEKTTRDSFSYHRPIPEHATEAKSHPVNECSQCHGALNKKSTRSFFEEDIPLPLHKVVIKHEVEVGYCAACRRQSSGYPIPSATSVLGERVKKYVCILSIGSRLSHAEIQEHLRDVFGLSVSLGEIGNILQTEADRLRPEYQALKESVRAQTGTHYDETGWKVQKEEQGKFAWVVAGTDNNDTVFSLGRSRGKGNIEDIGRGKVGISDDYGAYKNVFPAHQLCWAHPQRKLRDVAESGEIPEEKREQCKNAYSQFSKLYKDIRQSLGNNISPYLKRKFQTVFAHIAESHTLDPAPLVKIKTALRKNKEKYFTFLNHPGIPVDNNKAERALRHLVLKRRMSFGSKTQRGAETTSVLASVILSLKWNDPENWFRKYLKPGV